MTKLMGWPVNASAEKEPLPAVSFEMLRLDTGVWLPALTRINGVAYPELFQGIDLDVKNTYSNYIRFSTELKDVQIDASKTIVHPSLLRYELDVYSHRLRNLPPPLG